MTTADRLGDSRGGGRRQECGVEDDGFRSGMVMKNYDDDDDGVGELVAVDSSRYWNFSVSLR